MSGALMSRPLALTSGEPAGIGPDIAIAAWLRRMELNLPPFYLLGDRAFFAERAKILGLKVELADAGPEDASSAFAKALPVVATGEIATARPGQPDETSANAALASIRHAVDHVRAGRAGAVVTNPIAKSVLYRAGFRHPGHTEFLAELAADGGRAPRPVMMLWSPALAVVPVTIHLSLREALAELSTDLIVATARIAVADLGTHFGLAHPRLAVSGLNPHAGEDGSLGTEDIEIVAPAVEALRREGIDARGPLPADTMFHAAARKTYDCAICMYHDQALIPIKTIAFEDAVNVTLGLPFIRTSPDHGTAFDIAGTGKANPSSLVAALRLAARMAATQTFMSAIDDLPPLRDVIREHSLSARKSLGQNFLLDLNLTARIARAAGPLEGVTVIEVGPGPGGLTRALLALGAKRVIAVERDERALAPLDYISKRYPGRLEIVHADAQRFDPRPMLGGEPARIVANLPYNIATALLVDWLSIEPWPPWYDMMVLMFQREVAERIVARENDEAYGRLAVLANWRAETKILFDISPAAFVPQPKVTSSVVRLVPRNEPEPCDRRALEQVAAAAFGQRRKMLRQSLKSLSVDPARLAAAAEVDATRRAETIPVSGFVAMARELTDIRNTKSQSP